MSYLTLKSTVSEIYDYRNVDIRQFIPPFEPDSAKLEKDMKRIISSYGKKIKADKIENGDTVVISCESENKRFSKERIPVIVGKGLFSKELEAAIIGTEIGEKVSVTVGGDSVAVSIHEITRTLLPELTDDEVASWNMDGVSTVDGLRRHCIDRQIEKLLDESEDADMASAIISQTVARQSRFALDDAEQSYIMESADKKLKAANDAAAEYEAIDSDEEPEDETAKRRPGEDEMLKMMREICLNSFKTAVIGNKIAKEENTLLTDEDYEAAIQSYVDFSEGKLTVEQAKQKYPVIEFLIDRYADVYNKRVDAYVAECFKKALNP